MNLNVKLNLKKPRPWIVAAALMVVTATPVFAILGVGDIVFDPTSYASLLSQATTALAQLNTIQNNLEHFSFKQQWQTTLNALKNANVVSRFGETNGMSTALNTNSPGASTAAWTAATLPINGTTSAYLQGQTPGNSTQLSQLAMIEMADSVSPDCLTSVGQYRASRGENQAANGALTDGQFDASPDTNSEVEQLNLLNAAEAQKLSEMQSQGTMQVCLASQMTVANMLQRNAAAQDLNTAAAVQQQRTMNDTSAAGEANTWKTYIP